MSIYTNSKCVTEFRGSLFANKFSKRGFETYSTQSIGEFEEDLERLSGRKIDKKEDNVLICPSLFNRDKASDTDRGLDNVVFVNGVWLDFDGGDLKPPLLSKLFPNLRMTIYSSFSSSKASISFSSLYPD